MLYFLRPKHILHSIDSLYNLQSKSLVTTEFMHSNWITLSYYSSPKHKSLLHRFWCASLTSVHNNLEHGLAIVTESFSPLDLDYTTSFVKFQIRSDMTSHAILDNVYLSCTTTSKNQFELVTASLNHVLSMWKDSASQPLLQFPISLPDYL